jgi:hypothetical protein
MTKTEDHPARKQLLKLHAWVHTAHEDRYLDTCGGSTTLYQKLEELWEDGHSKGWNNSEAYWDDIIDYEKSERKDDDHEL